MATPKRAPEVEERDLAVTPPEEPSGTKKQAPPRGSMLRTLGLGMITGAADDDPSAIGTYASAGAAIGPAFLWTAPVTFPMMCAVVYLAAKLGQVSGKGLFQVLHDNYSRWILYPALPLLLLILLVTNNRRVMGNRVNTVGMNILGWITTVAIFAATIGSVASWFM